MFKKQLYLAVLALSVAACAQEAPAPAAAATDTAAAAAGQASAAVAAAAATATQVAAQLPAGDAERGKRFYIFCQACHTINAGGMNKVGPNLHGIVGSAAGQNAGFVYSEALAGSGLTWDAATLSQWIERPAELVPGTTMLFAGIADPQQRADLIAYLAQAGAE